ncbi:MATE family efflux transporter [Anaerolentibacter hominis]|uniref:MATE family efflux transporter n=1 Tax=Anaerolentibacter hominis TaxID=3079009 RepID=UPI0031B87A2A
METVRKENKMGTMPVNKLLLSMSIPLMISMVVQALYNVVDSVFVSRIGENALTAVSLAFPMQNLMIAVSGGTGVGINALLSRSLGEKNYDQANRAARNGIVFEGLSCLLFVVFGLFFSRIFFTVQTNIEEIINYGHEYLLICCGISVGLFGQMTFERLLQSTGKTFYTMITQGTGAIVNIIMDPILIFGYFGFPKMGVAGAAAATVLGQCVAMLLAVIFNLKVNKEISLSFKKFRIDWTVVRRIYSVGLPSIIMQSISSVMTFGMNKILMVFTSTATAVFGVYFKLQSFIFMPVFGLNNGMVPILSYNYGAKNKKRITHTIRLSILYAVLIMLVGLAVFQLLPAQLLRMFNASESMLSIGVIALRLISLSFLFAGFCIIAGSVFQALGNGMMSLIVSVIRQLVVLLPAAYLLSKTGVLNYVWLSFPIAEIASVILSALFLKKVFVKEINPLGEVTAENDPQEQLVLDLMEE